MRTTPLRIPIVLAIAGTALLAAGCGGGGGKPSSSTGAGGAAPSSSTGAAGGGSPKGGAQAAYKFSRCMRDHGVSSFPDPVVHSSPGSQSVGIKVTPAITGSPSFKAASKACQSILPAPSNSNQGSSAAQQAAHLKGLLSFATCMRNHHVPTFPDPNAQGQITPQMLSAAGLNLHAPAVDSAATACIPASDGQVNAAAVAQAESGGS